MKKTLIAVAALAATGAFAQVSVYGRLDVGYANTKTETNGVTTKANGVESHNSASSMWGIQGSEDLGGGLKATFKLEQDVYTANGTIGNSGALGGNNGTGSAAFNRTSLLGLTGSFGSIAFGRDYIPTFKLAAATDINSQSRITTVNTAAVVGSTRPELIHYSTPNLSGFQVNLAYGNNDNSVSTDAGKTNLKVTNLTATYMNGPLMVGVGVGSVEQKAAGAAATSGSLFGVAYTSAEKVTQNMVAASYDLGVARLVGNVIMGKATNGGTALGTFDSLKSREINIGAIVPMGKVTLRAQYGNNEVDAGAADKWDGNDFVVGAEYALSAKTAAFFKTGTYAKGNGIADALNTKTTSTAVGLRTVF